MLFALQTPQLQELDADTQVKPAVRSLKAAMEDAAQDAYFVITKRPDLLGHPTSLQRWLDYLAAKGVGQRDVMAFLLSAPLELFTRGTLHEANQVVAWLRSLGVKKEFLWTRVACVCPALLLKDTAADLQPTASFLMSLGLSPNQIQQMICVRPEVVAAPLDLEIRPLSDHLKSLGCSGAQAGEVLLAAPHYALRGAGRAAIAGRLAALAAAGVGADGVRAMLARGHTGFLTEKGAPQDALACLKELGYTDDQVRHLVTRCPAILSERPLELERKAAFLCGQLVMGREAALECPEFLAANLMQVIGPRHAFAEARQLEGRVAGTDGRWDLAALATGEDVAFVEALGGSINEYEGFRVTYEQEYTSKLSADAALEFQEELKKLGIWEGAATGDE
ncbi:MAG: hypothetical protein J3K34DRAFT_409553 [Monoraphidium minutum]|nr:MAG: hypothetical protein J3K34DRAFT_409553 [Monoraphidium minutum]